MVSMSEFQQKKSGKGFDPMSEIVNNVNDKSDKRRYLIVGTGRSGSSLLCSILAGVGAHFGMPNLSSWDRKSGAYEHPKLISACKWFSRSQKIAQSILPDALGREFCNARAQRDLAALMADVQFAKSPRLVWLVHWVSRLGYEPRILLSYRGFDGYAISKHVKSGWSLSDLAETYVAVNRTCMLQLHIFGGCAVDYKELVNQEEKSWAKAIASVTGLKYDDILQSRDRIVKPRPEPEALGVLDATAQAVYTEMRKLKGKVVCPGR